MERAKQVVANDEWKSQGRKQSGVPHELDCFPVGVFRHVRHDERLPGSDDFSCNGSLVQAATAIVYALDRYAICRSEPIQRIGGGVIDMDTAPVVKQVLPDLFCEALEELCRGGLAYDRVIEVEEKFVTCA